MCYYLFGVEVSIGDSWKHWYTGRTWLQFQRYCQPLTASPWLWMARHMSSKWFRFSSKDFVLFIMKSRFTVNSKVTLFYKAEGLNQPGKSQCKFIVLTSCNDDGWIFLDVHKSGNIPKHWEAPLYRRQYLRFYSGCFPSNRTPSLCWKFSHWYVQGVVIWRLKSQ